MNSSEVTTQIETKLGSFTELPFLFIGSGFSRRYLGLPDWEGLLKEMANLARNGDELAYSNYKNQVKHESQENLLPRTASLIQRDFDNNWFEKKHWIQSKRFDLIKDGVSPFKVAISQFCEMHTRPVTEKGLQDELAVFKRLANRSIAGVITTNYDLLIEDYLKDYKIYVGQDELIFKPIHGIHEIYKIHGCLTRPDSLIINEHDYLEFSRKNAYLAAKLLTIFVEHPIVFMGYSIQDSNIQRILSSIVDCLPNEKLLELKDRLLFIQWNGGDEKKVEIASHSITFPDEKVLYMTKIAVSDYKMVFSGLSKIRAKYDLKVLRQLKNDVYQLVLHNEPAEAYRTINLEDETENDPKTVAGVSLDSSGFNYRIPTATEIYRDVVLDDGKFEVVSLIDNALERLLKEYSNSLPVYKYKKQYGKKDLPKFLKEFNASGMDDFLSKTVINSKKASSYTWENFIENLEEDRGRALNRFQYLSEAEINVDELRAILIKIFQETPDILDSQEKSNFKTDLRRVIKILDWLLYGKEKTA